MDVVLDTVGGDYGTRSLRVLRPGGTLITLASPDAVPPAAEAEARGVRTGFTLVEPDYAGLLEIASLVEAGKLRAEIDTVLPLEQAANAHELGEAGRTTGKIVLAVAV